MGEVKKEEKKVSRRDYLKYTGAAIGGLVVGGALGYLAKPAEVIKETVTAPGVERTVTKTVEKTITVTGIPTTAPTRKEITVAVEAGSPHTDGYMKSRLPAFEKETGIKVNWVAIPHEQMREKFLMEVVVGKTGAFDVLQFDGPSIAEFVEGGGLEPIDPYVSSKDLSDFYPSALEPCEYKGKLYGLPYLVHDQILYYRTDLFKAAGLDPDRPPETWDELVDYAIKLTKNGVYGFVVEGKGPGHPEVPTKFLDFLYAAGGSIFGNDEQDFSTVTLDSPAGYEAMQFMVDLLHKYKVCPPGALGFDCADVHTMFMQGILAMAHNWPYQFGLANDPKASKVVGLFDVALMPRKRRIAGAAYAWFLAIPSSSRNKDSAWKFIEFMTSTEELKGLNLYNPGPIPRKSTAKLIQEDPEVPELTKKFIRVCTEMVEHGITNAVKHPKYAVIKDDIIGAAISEALSLKKTAKEAIDDAAAKIRALIKA